MWLPILRFMLQLDRNLFDKITLLVPSYRGLFEKDDSMFDKRIVEITAALCVSDIIQIIEQSRIDKLDGLMAGLLVLKLV
jgi:hypothetical protein